jgi:hypothetical protein
LNPVIVGEEKAEEHAEAQKEAEEEYKEAEEKWVSAHASPKAIPPNPVTDAMNAALDLLYNMLHVPSKDTIKQFLAPVVTSAAGLSGSITGSSISIARTPTSPVTTSGKVMRTPPPPQRPQRQPATQGQPAPHPAWQEHGGDPSQPGFGGPQPPHMPPPQAQPQHPSQQTPPPSPPPPPPVQHQAGPPQPPPPPPAPHH